MTGLNLTEFCTDFTAISQVNHETFLGFVSDLAKFRHFGKYLKIFDNIN